MAIDTRPILRHQIDFALYGLPSTTVRIDFPPAARAENVMLTTMPTLRLGASYADVPTLISNLSIQPCRIEFDIVSPPPVLPITLQIACGEPFIFGWLSIPENVQTSVATVVERIRIVGPSYWALPLGEGVFEPVRKIAAARPAAERRDAEKSAGDRSGGGKGAAEKPAIVKPASAKPGEPTPVAAPTPPSAESTELAVAGEVSTRKGNK